MSYIERRPHFRGKFILRKHIWDTVKALIHRFPYFRVSSKRSSTVVLFLLSLSLVHAQLPSPLQSKISKQQWVLPQCLGRLPEDCEAVRELLQYGLIGTAFT